MIDKEGIHEITERKLFVDEFFGKKENWNKLITFSCEIVAKNVERNAHCD